MPNSLQSSDHTVLPIVIQAGGVQLPAVLNGFRKQFGDLEVGNEGHSMIDGHPSDQVILPHKACVVVGQVDHQVNDSIMNKFAV